MEGEKKLLKIRHNVIERDEGSGKTNAEFSCRSLETSSPESSLNGVSHCTMPTLSLGYAYVHTTPLEGMERSCPITLHRCRLCRPRLIINQHDASSFLPENNFLAVLSIHFFRDQTQVP